MFGGRRGSITAPVTVLQIIVSGLSWPDSSFSSLGHVQAGPCLPLSLLIVRTFAIRFLTTLSDHQEILSYRQFFKDLDIFEKNWLYLTTPFMAHTSLYTVADDQSQPQCVTIFLFLFLFLQIQNEGRKMCKSFTNIIPELLQITKHTSKEPNSSGLFPMSSSSSLEFFQGQNQVHQDAPKRVPLHLPDLTGRCVGNYRKQDMTANIKIIQLDSKIFKALTDPVKL